MRGLSGLAGARAACTCRDLWLTNQRRDERGVSVNKADVAGSGRGAGRVPCMDAVGDPRGDGDAAFGMDMHTFSHYTFHSFANSRNAAKNKFDFFVVIIVSTKKLSGQPLYDLFWRKI